MLYTDLVKGGHLEIHTVSHLRIVELTYTFGYVDFSGTVVD